MGRLRGDLHRITVVLTVICALALSSTDGWARTWELSELGIRFETPEGFEKVSKQQRTSALELFNPKQNCELVVSTGLTEKLPLKVFQDSFPDWVKAEKGTIAHRASLSAGQGSAVAFVVTGLMPEQIETIYVYVVPPKGLPFSLIANYPADRREQTLGWLKSLVGGLRYGR